MKKITIIVFVCLQVFALKAQEALSEKEIKKFNSAESELKKYSDIFKYDTLPFEQKVEAIHNFIPRFVAILKEKNSFDYPFDSLTNIMKVTAPDQSFKIYTWQLKEPLGTHKYYGAIQLNSNPLKLIPLFDFSDTMTVHPDEILKANNWYGCIYYNCLQQNINGKNYYTLFGYDDADFVSDRKLMEFLSFDENSNPIFGAPLIHIVDTTNGINTTKNRFFIEFDDRATVRLNYDDMLEKVVFDHVIPPTEQQNGAWFTYLPDGTYEGFEWKNNKWEWIEKIFHYSIDKPDSPPMPKPILDNRD